MNRNESTKLVRMLLLVITGAALLSTVPLPSAQAAESSYQTSATSAASAVKVAAKKISMSTSAYNATLLIPVVSGLKDSNYQTELNKSMESAAMKDLEAVKQQAASDLAASEKDGYDFHRYELKLQYSAGLTGTNTDSSILSLKLNTFIYTGGAHGISRIDTYNVKNGDTGTPVTLKTLFGDSYPAAVNEEIKKQMARNAGNYFPDAFKGVAADQAFYIKDGSVQIVFQTYEIAPYAAGTPLFAIPLPASLGLAGSAAIRVETKTLSSGDDSYKAEIDVPVITGLRDTKYEEETNAILELNASKELEALKKAAAERKKASPDDFNLSEMKSAFEVTSDGSAAAGDIFSMKVTTYTYEGGANGETRVDTYNILNAAEASRATLETLFGDHYESDVGAAVQTQISNNQDAYFEGNEGFNGVTADTAFYVKGKDAYVVFQQGEIAPSSSGNPEFKVPLPVHGTEATALQVIVGGKVLSGIQAAPNKDGVAIVPIRDTAAALGFKVKWDARTSTVELSKENQWTSVSLGSDSYSFNKMAPVSLGAAPVYDSMGRITVPLAFFTEILQAKASYGDGSVTLQS